MTNFENETETQPALIKFEGTPTDQQSDGEPTRWRRFLNFFWPWARKAGVSAKNAVSLADEFRKAEISKRTAEADKIAAEAADITAAMDSKRQETVRTVNDEIQRIFSDDELPEMAKQLQLANLLAANPELAEQLEKIEHIYELLKLNHGTRIEVQPPKRLEEKTDSDIP